MTYRVKHRKAVAAIPAVALCAIGLSAPSTGLARELACDVQKAFAANLAFERDRGSTEASARCEFERVYGVDPKQKEADRIITLVYQSHGKEASQTIAQTCR